MGYTHYITHESQFTSDEWKVVRKDVIAILKTAQADGLKIGNACGEKEITSEEAVGETEICFDGLGVDSCETFAINRIAEEWSFCKTARTPYDIAVTAILAYLEHNHPDKISIGSDGDADDWEPGITLLKKALGARASSTNPPLKVL